MRNRPMRQQFSTLIITKPDDFKRLANHYKRLINNLPSNKIILISSEPVIKYIEESGLSDYIEYIDENTILPFNTVHKVLEKHMTELLLGEDLPRGATGWYYQQFLKMLYAYHCPDEYYMVWDGDTIPCAPFSMFQEESGLPYLDLKNEYHEEYFSTIEKILPGMKKCIRKSFISEHMLFNCELMKQLIKTIESNSFIEGESFWEKILHAIPPMKVANASFSEFETYGTFVCFTNPSLYKLREWHSFRLGAEFFDPETICDRDFEWLGKDFQAISFEKNQFVRPDNKNLFDNPTYQSKLSARKMLEIAQEEFHGGYIEIWDDNDTGLLMDPLAAEKDNNGVLNITEDALYEHMGDSLALTNPNQAYLCFENAEFLCTDPVRKQYLCSKKDAFFASDKVTVKKTAISIVSYNNKDILKQCIYSIKEHCAPSAYSIVVVDNASTDGAKEWLEKMSDDITVLLSNENLGFPKGCNACIKYAEPGQDIFLLNNDTRLTHNSLFWLRMGLYSSDDVGATGCIANYSGNDQILNVSFSRPEDYVTYAKKINVPMAHPHEEKSRLCGFAMLIRRSIVDKIGGLDEAFSPGYFEDDDYSLRIKELGYRLLVCHNSFIYHIGSQSFNQKKETESVILRNYQYAIEKWGYDLFGSAMITDSQKEILTKLSYKTNDSFNLLEIGAGSGNFLSMIKYSYPNANLYGIESNSLSIKHGVKSIPIVKSIADNNSFPFPESYFDIIVINSSKFETTPENILLIESLLKNKDSYYIY